MGQSLCVQNLADAQWRLDRISSLENGIFALGRLRYAGLLEEEPCRSVRVALLDAYILMTEGKHFGNLHRQESRLRRQYQQDAKELKELQAQRKKEQEEKEQTQKAASPKILAAAHGFKFTNPAEPTDPPQSREQSDRVLVRSASVPSQTAVVYVNAIQRR